ncbi:hypothetical protein SAMN05443429_1013 [Cruoricaptor ignavus]|uniref:Uncharacterized protein n=1 Tax=Cruoricaptor ignavus TaxID=1118202 RepID=A0A1M5ZX31_9FLAO|nr:hypothetical protein [Cruoricaptor ignavus]SHI28814.1 hypothetical protein SAMN05443429_1013 [Cruoricaptor ignavus]
MNYIRHLTGFYEKILNDDRLNPSHISLYLALFQFWNLNRFQNPVSISRSEMMKLSKISALSTYHKCISQLQDFGYIEYSPSFNPFKGSTVSLLNFEAFADKFQPRSQSKKQTSEEQPLDKHWTTDNTGTEQALEQQNEHSINYINTINSTNNKNITRTTQPKYLSDRQTPSKKNNAGKTSKKNTFTPPEFAEVQRFFAEKNAPPEEAEKFFNHYESNGWLVGGKSKMKNWNAAARNWLINVKKFSGTAPIVANTAGHLSASTGKSYQEKL